MLPAVLFAEDKVALMKDMAAQEAAMASIQKALLYSSKSGVVEGVAALKASNKVATLKEGLVNYLPKEKLTDLLDGLDEVTHLGFGPTVDKVYLNNLT